MRSAFAKRHFPSNIVNQDWKTVFCECSKQLECQFNKLPKQYAILVKKNILGPFRSYLLLHILVFVKSFFIVFRQ
jgi:hypothetical protein